MRNLLSLSLLLISINLIAQVGIGTTNPHESAMLEVRSTNKGVLLPRIEDTDAIKNPMESVLVYDETHRMLKIYINNEWLYLTTSKIPSDTSSIHFNQKVGINTEPSVDLEVNGDVKITGDITVNGTGLLPIGSIVMWSGALDNFNNIGLGIDSLTGWALCNGNTQNNVQTPDLRGRFVVGSINSNNNFGTPTMPSEVNPSNNTNGISNPSYSISDIGGESNHLLTGNESGTSSHKHNITQTPHKHPLGGYVVAYELSSGVQGPSTKAGSSNITQINETNNSSANITINNSSTSNAVNPHENRPPYYAIAYIIKVK